MNLVTEKYGLLVLKAQGWIDFDDTDLLSTDVWEGFPGRIVKK